MSKTASPDTSHGVGLSFMSDLLSRLIGAPSRLQRIRLLLSLVQDATGAARTGLVLAQSSETIYWTDRTEHPEAYAADSHETHLFMPLMQWAEQRPAGFISAEGVAEIPPSYDISGLIILHDQREVVGILLLAGPSAVYHHDEEMECLLGLLTLNAIEQRTTNNLNKFLGEFAHDQRNSLNVVSMSADVLNEMRDMPPKSKLHLTRIFDNSLQIGNQIENALSVERYDPETDEYHMHWEEVDLIDLRREISDRYVQIAQGKRITIKTPHLRGSLFVIADLGMITRAITNLIDNALKFTPEGGTSEVILEKDKQDARLIVKDSGPGIAPENMERIFERKVRIRQARHVRGLGLGLYIVRSVALKHGGKVWVESTLGEGSTFYFSLPLKPRAAAS